MRRDSPRYHEVSVSQFAHERAGLDQLRELLPDRAPFHVWTNFEFRDSQGKWHEVDALVLGERRLHLVELKHYQGQIGGNSYRWQRGRFSEDNPLILARRKAQRLASVIKDRLRELDPTGAAGPVPFIQESVYLHADNFRVVMADADRRDLFGPDDRTRSTNLPSLAERLLEPANGQGNKLIANDDLLVALFEKIGFGVRREREVGSWRLIEQIAEGAGWQDWAAEHKLMHTRRARIRFFVTPPGAADSERIRINALAKREYEVTTRLHHDGVARPEDIVEDELGLGLVYPRNEDEQRLDLWLADNGATLSLDDRVKLVRQLAETVKYVHQRHLVHRALSPAAITVTGTTDAPRLSIGDWQFAGDSEIDAAKSRGTATRLFAAADAAQTHASGSDPAGSYLAPEARWVSDVDRVRLDVFALGALSYLMFAGTPPAADAIELRARVQNDHGLNLAADVPELPHGLRSMVLAATTPMVSDRTPDADAFLAALDAAVTEAPTTQEPDDDPLDAPPGTLIAGRYTIKRRLGSGSTAVGLLVLDTQNADEPCVLKVAVNHRANKRLADEAEVLRSVAKANSPRLVRLLDGPLPVGTRQALLLESAGEQTLADVLKSRRRLSLDLLERWGTDLLEAVVALDQAGLDHRDIKPANLGVRETRGDRTKHLVLFDFSLSRAGASAIEAGTPPYLDPFLGPPRRQTFDSAAEWYAAAVTLFEMATGSANGPVFGDGQSDPRMLSDEASLDPAAFDPSIAGALTSFFTIAFRRSATERFHTASELLTAWRATFSTPATTVPDEAVAPADVKADTPLRDSGLTARALSALEPLRLETVGDLATVDPARLTRLSGVAVATRSQIVERAKAWRHSFGTTAPIAVSASDGPLAQPLDTAEQLAGSAGPRAPQRREMARAVLGLDGSADPFATLAELAVATGKGGGPQVSILLAQIQKSWSEDDQARATLDALAALAIAAIEDLGQVARITDVVSYLLPPLASSTDRRITSGLVRFALDRADDVAAGAGEPAPVIKRRSRKVLLVATDSRVLDAGVAMGALVDKLLADATRAGQLLIPPARAVERLAPKWPATDDDGHGLARPADRKLTRLAAQLSEHGAVSARGELHDRDLDAATALRLAVTGLTPGQELSVDDLLATVRSRFPDLPNLPRRTRLDQLVVDAELGLRWNDRRTRYEAPADPTYTTAGYSATMHTIGEARVPLAPGQLLSPAHAALTASCESHAFLALGLPRTRRLRQAARELETRYDAQSLDVTELVIAVLREQAEAAGVPWSTVTAADAKGTERDWQGITALVRKGEPQVAAALTSAATTRDDRPLLLTDAAPLARYGLMPVLAQLADITTPRARGVWLLLPLGHQTGPTLDGVDLQLSHSGQFLTLDEQWFTTPSTLEGEPA